MQQLKESLESYAAKPDGELLHRAASDWAAHALSTYRGKLLKKALNISRAIADFTCELESLSP